MLMIKDLPESKTLDRAALAEVRGGFLNATAVRRSVLFGSPVSATNVDTYVSNYSSEVKLADVRQNTLALFGSAAVSNASVTQL